MAAEFNFEIPEYTICSTLYAPDPSAVSSAKVSCCLSDYRDENQNTLAHWAYWNDNETLLNKLIADQHDIMQQVNSLNMKPSDLIHFQYIDRLRHWPGIDEDITNYRDSNGNTILHADVVHLKNTYYHFCQSADLCVKNDQGFAHHEMWPIELVLDYFTNYNKTLMQQIKK